MSEHYVKKLKTVKGKPNVQPKYKPRFNKIKVNVAECPLCGDIVFSRTRHDYRTCSCENISVDGGFEYFKLGWRRKQPKTYVLNIVQTKHQLYDDWNTSADEFGLIKLEHYKKYGIQATGYGRATEGVRGRKGVK